MYNNLLTLTTLLIPLPETTIDSPVLVNDSFDIVIFATLASVKSSISNEFADLQFYRLTKTIILLDINVYLFLPSFRYISWKEVCCGFLTELLSFARCHNFKDVGVGAERDCSSHSLISVVPSLVLCGRFCK